RADELALLGLVEIDDAVRTTVGADRDLDRHRALADLALAGLDRAGQQRHRHRALRADLAGVRSAERAIHASRAAAVRLRVDRSRRRERVVAELRGGLVDLRRDRILRDRRHRVLGRARLLERMSAGAAGNSDLALDARVVWL